MSDNQQPSHRECKKCKRTKLLDEFAIVYAKNSRGQNYRQHTCADCAKQIHAERMRKARAKNPEKYRKHQKDHRERRPDRVRLQQKQSRERLRDLVFNAYGGYVCACCGETCKTMLTIDHIAGDGNEHRQALSEGKAYATRRSGLGDYVYRDLRDRGFPEGFQVLCYNCNISKHRYGQCEHTMEGSETRVLPVGSSDPKRPAPEKGEDIVRSCR